VQTKRKKARSLLFKLLGLSFGLFLLYYVIQSYGGLDKILFYLKKAGFGYVWVILNSFFGIVLYTFAWRAFLPVKDHAIRFYSLLKVRLCGEGVNFMTPLGFMAGDPVRVILLKKYLGPQSHLRSVVLDRTMHLLSAHVFNVFGMLLLVFSPHILPRVYSLSLLGLYTVTSLLIAKFCIDLLSGRGLGVFDKIFHKLKLHERFPKFQSRLDELREDLLYYKDKPKRPFWISFALHFSGRCTGFVEIALILWCLIGRFEWEFSAMLTAMTSFITVAFAFIPGSLGALESLYAHFFSLFGLDPQIGITIQLIRRLRTFFWIGLGIFLLDYHLLSQFVFQKKKK
jgi:uncharacterized protein (TIRG00374 family)